jgi:hypothetical protein
LVLLNEPMDPVEFLSVKAATVLQPYGGQPEFGDLLVTLDMHMGWLIAVPGIEKAAIRANT